MKRLQDRASLRLHPELKVFDTAEERKLALERCDAWGVETILYTLLAFSLIVIWIWMHGSAIRFLLVTQGVPRSAVLVLVLALVVGPALGFIAMAAILWRERRIVRPKLQRLLRLERKTICPKCYYRLTGNTSGTCPECGTPAPQPLPSTRENVQAVIDGIVAGKVLETFDRYYDDQVVMSENGVNERVGKAANRAYEESFVNNVQFHRAEVGLVIVDGDHAAVEWVLEFAPKGGSRIVQHQVALQTWKNDKIIREVFYHG